MKRSPAPLNGMVFKKLILKPALTLIISLCLFFPASSQCTGDCTNGKGKFVDSDGNTFDGQWKNSKIDGIGTLTLPNGIKYYGEFRENNMHGYGVIYTASGSVAQSGIFENNKLSSTLTEREVLETLKRKQNEGGSGSVATTGCTGDCQNGTGTLVDADGNKFEGQWKNGKIDGIGTLTLPDGIKYYGEFRENNMHGYGVVYLANGSVAQSGIFESNKLSTTIGEREVLEHLKGKQNQTGSVSTDGCTGDCQNGRGTLIDKDGNKFDGQWKNGKIDGIGTLTLPDGIKYYGEFRQNNMHGYGVIYLANGSVAQSGTFENNKLATTISEREVLETLKRKQNY